MSIDLVGPDGKPYAFDGDEAALANAKAQGFRVASEIGAVESALDTAKAGVLGAAQGFSAGLVGAGLGAGQGDEETPESAKARWAGASEMSRAREESPIASGLGEIAGMLTSPVNALVPAVEGTRAATILGRLGQKSLSGAAIGTLYGAGNAVSDAALGDVPLTAEKLVAGAGLGALLGGLGGGLGGAIEEGAARVLPKLATMMKGGQSALDDVADHFALKSFRNTAKELRKYSDEEIENAVKVAREGGHLKLSPEAMEKSLAAEVATTGPAKGAFLDAADAAGTRPNYSAFLKRLDDFEASLNPVEREAMVGGRMHPGDLAKARSALLELGQRPVTATGKMGSGWRALDDLKQTIQAKAKFSKGPVPLDDVTFGLKRKLAGIFREELDNQLVPALGAEGQKFLDVKKLYGSLKTAQRMAGTGAGRGQGFNMLDVAFGVVGGVAHPFGLAGALGTKFVREHGAAVAAQIADRLAKSPALTAVAQSFANALPATAPKLGAYGPALLLAAERSPTLALAQHMVTAEADPEYAANAQMAGLRPETPDEHVASMGRATDLAAMRGALKAQDEAIDEALSRVVKGHKPPKTSPVLKTQDFGSKRMRQTSIEGHRRRVDEIRMLATDPQALIDRVAANTAGLGDAAPAATAQMTALAQRAVAYLAQQAEAPPRPGPLARERTPTEADRHLFSLKLQAVQSPMSILDAAARGTLVRAQIDAVRAVYPSLARAIEDRALEQLATGEQMPYRARLMLSMLTGVDADGTMSPMAIAANQNAIASASGKPSEKMPAPTGDGDNINGASRMATPGQRKELESEAA